MTDCKPLHTSATMGKLKVQVRVQLGVGYPGEGRARARSRRLDRPSPQGEPALPAGEPDGIEETAPGASRGRPAISLAMTSSARETELNLAPARGATAVDRLVARPRRRTGGAPLSRVGD